MKRNSKYMLIGGGIGTASGAGIGLATQVNYENELRLRHPELTESEIKKEVKNRKIKAASIGALSGLAIGTGTGYGLSKIDWKRKIDKDNQVPPTASGGSNNQNASNRTPGSRRFHPRQSNPYLGRRPLDYQWTDREGYYKVSRDAYEKTELEKSMLESGLYSKNDPRLKKAMREAAIARRRYKDHPDFIGVVQLYEPHPVYKIRPRIKRSRGPELITSFNLNKSDPTPISSKEKIRTIQWEKKSKDESIDKLLRNIFGEDFDKAVRSSKKSKPKKPSSGQSSDELMTLLAEKFGKDNVRKFSIISYTKLFSSSDRVVCMFYDKGEGTDHLTKPCTLIEVPKIKQEFQDKAKRSHWRIVDLVVAQDMDEVDELIEEYE